MSEIPKKTKSILQGFGSLLDYPGTDWPSLTESCAQLVAGETPEIVNAFTRFRDGVLRHSLSGLQELYTRTFDLNPVCALEIGYHLFGENYKRGEFLANLRSTEAPFDLGQDKQLPDYLPVLLRLLTKLEDEELRTALIVECMVPAIEKMITSLNDSQNPYRSLLQTVQPALRSQGGVKKDEPFVKLRASLPVLTSF